jgi:hypothetical protein
VNCVFCSRIVPQSVIAACILIVNPSQLPSRELTGVVYSNHSGPSANGAGRVQLSTKTALVGIHYQKPIKLDSSDHRCYEVGAVWTVQTSQSELLKAHCAGKLDEDVHSAWMAVRSYIKTVANGVGQELGYQPSRRGPVRARMGEVDVDLAGYLNFGSTGMCLEMKEHIDGNAIIIESSADCYFIPELEFRVERTLQATWQVTRVKAAPQNR